VAGFVSFLDESRPSVGRMIEQAGIPRRQLYEPGGLVSLHACYRFLELSSEAEGMPDLGRRVADAGSVFRLGRLGAILRSSTTVLDYLRTGVRLVSTLENSGACLWLTREKTAIRVNQLMAGGTGPGPAIADAHTLVMTVNALREMLGYDWWPDEVRLRQGTAERLGSWTSALPGLLLTEQARTSFTVPFSVLMTPVATTLGKAVSDEETNRAREGELPDSFLVSVERLVDAMLLEGNAAVATVAEAAGMSIRGFQRRLAEADTSFSQVLTACRLKRARQWLQATAMPIAEIAAELDYTDASNFARAFRRETGLSPAAYRRVCMGANTGPDG
jgi:AraC-like DNA-binding protein